MHPFRRYAQALLPFHAPEAWHKLPPPLPPGENARAVARMTRAAMRGPQGHVLLLGLGSGALARELARDLPPSVRLTVAELHPQRTRVLAEQRPAMLDWWQEDPSRQLLVDNSPWAMLLLLHANGGLQHITPLRNPELGGDTSAVRYGLLQKLLVLAREERLPPLTQAQAAPSLSAAAILRPDEPDLGAFLAQFPHWLEELVLVWDAEAPPAHGLQTAAPLKEYARPLGNDFAAQRNAMLDACRGDWVFYLDGDEHLAPESWELLPRLIRNRKLQGCWLPRRTFYPDMDHALAGMGLWPDLQLRLFRNAAGLRFVNPVHERLQGLEGAVAIAPGLPILHYNQIRNDDASIDDKYELFSRAGGVRHVRSRDYPHLPLSFFQALEEAAPRENCITLRYNPAP